MSRRADKASNATKPDLPLKKLLVMTRNDDLIGERVRITQSLERYPLPDLKLIGQTGRLADWKTGPDNHTTHWLVEPDGSSTSVAQPAWIWVKNLTRITEEADRNARVRTAKPATRGTAADAKADPRAVTPQTHAQPAPTPTSSNIERCNIPNDLKFRVWSRDAWHCRYCLRPIFFAPTLRELERRAPGHGYYHRNGKEGAMLTLLQMGWSSADHFVPVTHGGQNTIDNLVAACMECNISRGNEPAESKSRDLRAIPPQLRALGWDGFAAAYPSLVAEPDEWCKIIRRHSLPSGATIGPVGGAAVGVPTDSC